MAYGAKPPELYSYGAKITQCATLVFDIELLKIDGREENEASIENIPPVYSLPKAFGTEFGAHVG